MIIIIIIVDIVVVITAAAVVMTIMISFHDVNIDEEKEDSQLLHK